MNETKLTPEKMQIALAKASGYHAERHERILPEDADFPWRLFDGKGNPRGCFCAYEDAAWRADNLPDYPEDANAALQVVALMYGIGWRSDITQFVDGTVGWDFRMAESEGSWIHESARAKTIPLAICEAACRALRLMP